MQKNLFYQRTIPSIPNGVTTIASVRNALAVGPADRIGRGDMPRPKIHILLLYRGVKMW